MNPLKEMESDSISSKCMSPLIETENEENFFFEVEGCGLQCEDPFFSPEEHDQVHHHIRILSAVGFTLSAFAMIPFVINRKVSNSYPGVIVFYMSICLTLVNIGYLIQFFPGAREKIVCNGDGTIRLQHPRAGENLLCVITFLLTYYFLLAFWIWFGLLSYSWYVTFHEPGSSANKEALKKKGPYFHISAWCIPLGSFVAIMAMNQVDGDPMRGICFVSDVYYMFLVFWLVPLLIAKLVVFIFVISVFIILIRVKLKTTNLEEKKVVFNFILRIGICIMGLFFITVSELWYYAYDVAYPNESMESLRVYIVCKAMHSANPGELPMCGLKSKPGPYILPEINIFVLSIMLFFWVTLDAWRAFFCRLCSPSTRSTRNFEKHKLNLKTFQQINQVDISHYISDSFNQASCYISDSFNEVNLDSMSMQISEQEYDHVLRHQRRKTRKERERFIQASRMAWVAGRRSSDSSLQSSLVTVSIVAAKNLKVSKSTSTGDLEAQAAAALQAAVPLPQGASVNPPRPVPPDTIIPPFMHGMDGDRGLNPGLHPRTDRRTTRSTANQQRLPMFPPGAFQNPTNGVVPPIYKLEYMMNLPFWYMYPAYMYAAAGYNYSAAPHLAFGQSPYAIFQNCPEQSRVDSTSEGEFPIFSNSDCTDCSDFKYRKQDICN